MPLIIVFAFGMLQSAIEPGYKLLQVQAVSRHGVRERTSTNFIPTLPCDSFKKFQTITELGRIQNYYSGKGLRETYEADLFAGKKYVPANHIFQSTDEIKTISSIQSVFQGVFYDAYPNNASEEFVTVPSYVPGPVDYVLNASVTCAAKINETRLLAPPSETTEWKNKQAEYALDFGYIYDQTGFGPTVTGTPGARAALTLNTIPRAAEQVILAYEHGFTHPTYKCVYNKDFKDADGVTRDLNKVAIAGATFRNQMMNRPYGTTDADTKIAKLQASPYFNNAIREFLTKVGKTEEQAMKERSFIYIAGDNANILAPIQLVGRESFGRAPFGSVFFFELYVANGKVLPYKEEDLLVKVGWRDFKIKNYNTTAFDSDDISMHPLVEAEGLAPYNQVEWYNENLCGAGKKFCTIAELRQRIYTDKEWKTECNIPLDESENNNDDNSNGNQSQTNDNGLDATSTGLLCVVIILAVLFVGAIVVAVIFYVRGRLATAKANPSASTPSSAKTASASEKGKGSGSGSGSAPASSNAHQKSGSADTEADAANYWKE